MRKLMLLLLVVYSFGMCKSPKVFYKDEHCVSLPQHSIDRALKSYDAEKKNYSLLIFISSFVNDSLIVLNNSKILFNNTITSDKSLGLAKIVRIDNRFNVKIKDI